MQTFEGDLLVSEGDCMVTIGNGVLTARIDDNGAQLCSLASPTTEYIYDDFKVWPKHAPVLFPFAGRLFEQKFRYGGREYGPVPIHGFAPYAKYVACGLTDSSVTMEMVVTDEIRAIWPFDFGFSVHFELKGSTLSITYKVTNKGQSTMYYGMGSHPGFNVPISKRLAFEDYYIEFPEAGDVLRNMMDDACLDTGCLEPYTNVSNGRLPLGHGLFDRDAVILSNTGHRAVIKSDKDTKSITVDYPDTRYCAVWHKVKMEVPFVCIEPWTSLPGCAGKVVELEGKADYNVLPGGRSREHHLDITINE